MQTDWGVIITVIACLFTIISVTVGLFLYLASKIDGLRSDINKEMKDFHGRLCSLESRYQDLKKAD